MADTELLDEADALIAAAARVKGAKAGDKTGKTGKATTRRKRKAKDAAPATGKTSPAARSRKAAAPKKPGDKKKPGDQKTVKPKTSRRKADKSKKAASEPALEPHPMPGAETDVDDRPRGIGGIGGLLGPALPFAALIALVMLTTLGWRSQPPAPALTELVVDGETQVPGPILRRWLATFSYRTELVKRPTPQVLDAFADHLAVQHAVAEVQHVLIDWQTDPNQPDQPGGRILRVGVVLREPVLPIRRLNGRIDWVDADGRELPGELAGPASEPRVLGIESATEGALDEVLAFWPLMRDQLLAARDEGRFQFDGLLIDRIHLDEQLNERGDRGIVLHLDEPALRILWGRPGEERFGVTMTDKVANLLRTLTCQGTCATDLQHVSEINLRFPEPFAVIADSGP